MNVIRKTMGNRKAQSGQAILLLAVVMIGLAGMLGLAIDGGGLFFLHRDTQNAVDAALIAALYAKCTAGVNDPDPEPRIRFAALDAARANGFVDQSQGGNAEITVDTHYTPSGATDQRYIKVAIVAYKPSFFIQLVYHERLSVTTSGVGYCEPSRLGLLPGDSAIISLRDEQDNCNLGHDLAISNTGTSYMRVHNSGVFSNSPHPSCALNARGTSDFIVDGPCQTVGGYNPSEMTCASSATGQTPLPSMNPLHELDRPTCVPGEHYISSGGNVTGANPGTYDQWIIQGDFTLSPGVYCVDDIRINSHGHITGEGVILYMPPGNGGITINGQGYGDLKAPTTSNCELGDTCDWLGLLIWSDVSNPDGGVIENGELHLNGGSEEEWYGMVYAPGSECTLEGNQDATFIGVFACYSVRGAGTQDLDIYYEFPEFLKVPPKVSITE